MMGIKKITISSALAITEAKCPLRNIQQKQNRRTSRNSVLKLYLISFLEVFSSYSWKGQ